MFGPGVISMMTQVSANASSGLMSGALMARSAPLQCCATSAAFEAVEIRNRVEPKNPFPALFFECDDPTDFRHPVLIDLPDRPEQRLRRRHLREPRRRIFDCA